MTRFEIGKTYYTRSLCDHDCIYSAKVIARTAKSVRVILDARDGVKLRRVSPNYDGTCEVFAPFGSYSMSPTIRADKVAP